jgi:hypothetical protein
LWKQIQTPVKKNISPIDNNIIISLITQNQEFKDLIIEQNKHIIELSKDKSISNSLNNINNSHNTTNNNNHFNLQLFLNERCKNALNMVDFIKQLNVTIDDLEETIGTYGSSKTSLLVGS